MVRAPSSCDGGGEEVVDRSLDDVAKTVEDLRRFAGGGLKCGRGELAGSGANLTNPGCHVGRQLIVLDGGGERVNDGRAERRDRGGEGWGFFFERFFRRQTVGHRIDRTNGRCDGRLFVEDVDQENTVTDGEVTCDGEDTTVEIQEKMYSASSNAIEQARLPTIGPSLLDRVRTPPSR